MFPRALSLSRRKALYQYSAQIEEYRIHRRTQNEVWSLLKVLTQLFFSVERLPMIRRIPFEQLCSAKVFDQSPMSLILHLLKLQLILSSTFYFSLSSFSLLLLTCLRYKLTNPRLILIKLILILLFILILWRSELNRKEAFFTVLALFKVSNLLVSWHSIYYWF